MPAKRKKPLLRRKEEEAWKVKIERDYLRLGYEKTVEKNRPLNLEIWKHLGFLLRKHRQKYKKVGNEFIPI